MPSFSRASKRKTASDESPVTSSVAAGVERYAAPPPRQGSTRARRRARGAPTRVLPAARSRSIERRSPCKRAQLASRSSQRISTPTRLRVVTRPAQQRDEAEIVGSLAAQEAEEALFRAVFGEIAASSRVRTPYGLRRPKRARIHSETEMNPTAISRRTVRHTGAAYAAPSAPRNAGAKRVDLSWRAPPPPVAARLRRNGVPLLMGTTLARRRAASCASPQATRPRRR